MKRCLSVLAAVMVLSLTVCKAQTYKKDTIMVDTTQMEKIRKMPMDTIQHKMPVKPLIPDTTIHEKENKGLKLRNNSLEK